jgi:hypothetical protein
LGVRVRLRVQTPYINPDYPDVTFGNIISQDTLPSLYIIDHINPESLMTLKIKDNLENPGNP